MISCIMCYYALVTARKCKEGNSKHLQITARWTYWKYCQAMKTRLSLWWLAVTPELAIVEFLFFSYIFVVESAHFLRNNETNEPRNFFHILKVCGICICFMALKENIA